NQLDIVAAKAGNGAEDVERALACGQRAGHHHEMTLATLRAGEGFRHRNALGYDPHTSVGNAPQMAGKDPLADVARLEDDPGCLGKACSQLGMFACQMTADQAFPYPPDDRQPAADLVDDAAGQDRVADG